MYGTHLFDLIIQFSQSLCPTTFVAELSAQVLVTESRTMSRDMIIYEGGLSLTEVTTSIK